MRDVITLSPEELPRQWYNSVPDLPKPLPPPISDERIDAAVRVTRIKSMMDLDKSTDRWLPIPDDVRELYMHVGRPRPLYRAKRLEEYLKTPARLYYKREDLSPPGSFKLNSSLVQAYYARKEGKRRLATETGAGQTGTAVAYSARLLGMDCTIYWVRYAYRMKPDRVTFNKMLGAEVLESPSEKTEIGRKYLRENPEHRGDIAFAEAESVEDSLNRKDTVAPTGSVMNHLLIHQSIIGLEVRKQLESIEEKPDVLVSCVGGGGNFGGLILPFLKDKLDGKLPSSKMLAVEPDGCARLQRGEYRYDYLESLKLTPQLKMYTLGMGADLPSLRAEGLRFHAMSPIISLLKHEGIVDVTTYPSDERAIFEAATLLLQKEGVLACPESSYAVRGAIDEAIKAKDERKEKVIVFNISGMGYLDLKAYWELMDNL